MDVNPSSSESGSIGAEQPEINLQNFIASGRQSPALAGIRWDSAEWLISPDDPVARKIRSHRSYRPTLSFTTRESSGRGNSRVPTEQRQAMPDGYADFAKADLRHHAEASSAGLDVLRRLLSAHQFLEQTLRTVARGNTVANLTLRHFQRAEEAMTQSLGAHTSYKVAQHLERIGRTIDARHLAYARIGFVTTIKRPSNADELTEEGHTRGMAKMISSEALDAIARISSAPADDNQRLICRILDLFVCGGFRAGEVLRLAADCWVSVEAPAIDPAAPRSVNEGIQFVVEKSGDFETKWLPRQSAELARRAVNDITRITKPMREVARWMEDNPGRLWAFRDMAPDDMVTGRDATSRMGLTANAHANWKLFREKRGGEVWFRVGDIEALYLAGYGRSVLTLRNGKQQRLSETLILCWTNQFHATRGELKFLPRAITLAMFSDYVCPPASRSDEVTGLLSGTGHKVTSHQFRHWLNTLAANSGLSEVHQAKWFGRLEIIQNKTYQHKTLEERRRLTWELIMKGEAHGEVARMAMAVAVEDREAFVKSIVEAAHTTLYGVCVHNFACSPCPNHLQCLRKCGDYLRIKGDQAQRMALMDLRRLEEIQLQQAQLALDDGFTDAAKWVEHGKEVLEGIDEALAVDGDNAVSDGAEVKVFPGESKFTKLLS